MNSEDLITDLKQFIAATVSQSATDLRRELMAEIDKRFDEQERRFDKRFDEIDERLNKRIDEIEERLDAILNCLGEYVEECDAKFALHGKTIKQHGVRLKRLEMKAA